MSQLSISSFPGTAASAFPTRGSYGRRSPGQARRGAPARPAPEWRALPGRGSDFAAPVPAVAERFFMAAMQPDAGLETRRLLEAAYRRRLLGPDHWRIVAHYGKRQTAPNPDISKERRAYYLWYEACRRVQPLLTEIAAA